MADYNQSRRSTQIDDLRNMPLGTMLLHFATTPFVEGVASLAHPFEGNETIPLSAYTSPLSRAAGFQDVPPPPNDFWFRSQQWGAK